jgi:hypothetical protein
MRVPYTPLQIGPRQSPGHTHGHRCARDRRPGRRSDRGVVARRHADVKLTRHQPIQAFVLVWLPLAQTIGSPVPRVAYGPRDFSRALRTRPSIDSGKFRGRREISPAVPRTVRRTAIVAPPPSRTTGGNGCSHPHAARVWSCPTGHRKSGGSKETTSERRACA